MANRVVGVLPAGENAAMLGVFHGCCWLLTVLRVAGGDCPRLARRNRREGNTMLPYV